MEEEESFWHTKDLFEKPLPYREVLKKILKISEPDKKEWVIYNGEDFELIKNEEEECTNYNIFVYDTILYPPDSSAHDTLH